MKATFKTITANPTAATTKTAAYGYLGFALYESFSHITALFARWGSNTPWSAPIMIDSLILLGRMARSTKHAETTRRVGLIVQILGILASLFANIKAGETFGDRAQGVLVITGLLIVEWLCERTHPVEKDTAAAKKAAASAASRQAAATRKANKAAAERLAAEQARKAQEKRERDNERRRLARGIADIEAAANGSIVTTAVAPVSPAVGYLPADERGYL